PFRLSRLCLFIGLALLCAREARAITTSTTSPYVTQQVDVPLNQSTNDSINGVLPYFNSHPPVEPGSSISWLADATSASAPEDNVIPGPDNTWVGMAWDFGDPGDGFTWKLDRVDLWIAAGDNLRRGIRADLSVSSIGGPGDFTVITNSLHWDAMTQNDNFNYVRYDFPNTFVPGPTADKDKYSVKDFRYLRLNSLGHKLNDSGTDWQTRFTEVDAWVSKVALPSQNPLISSIARNANGDVTFSWSTISGRTYDVEYKNALNETDWTHLDTVIADAESESILDPSTSGAQRYYRIVLEP
ncbi:MAG: hypothetical protein JWM68_5788, partial [Verrucomicrobiales bacterium]|nr:hypothetical protein [Verrucomicrobiales bacterium]